MRVIVLLAFLASLPLPAVSLAQPATGRCPAEPATAAAVAAAAPAWSGAGMARPDLAQSAVTVMLQEIERVGLTPVAALQASATSYLPTQTAGPQATGPCVPVVTLAVATTAPQMIALYVSRYTEQVTVTASVTLPDGRLWQRTRTADCDLAGGQRAGRDRARRCGACGRHRPYLARDTPPYRPGPLTAGQRRIRAYTR